jgi:hypothetical protein
MIGLLIFVAVVLVFVVRRRRRAMKLAGLDAAAPVFSVEPPARRLSGWRQERL